MTQGKQKSQAIAKGSAKGSARREGRDRRAAATPHRSPHRPAAARPHRDAAGAIVWFTGLPSSGKSTLARRVQLHFAATGRPSVMLDSDELREVLGARSYGPEDRDRFYRSLGALARVLAGQGLVVLVAATAPRRDERDRVRSELASGPAPRARFVEVWVKTPLAACEARDPKGLYAQARTDADTQLPGVGVDYEAPLAPEVIADGGFDDTALAAIECRLDIAGSAVSGA